AAAAAAGRRALDDGDAAAVGAGDRTLLRGSGGARRISGIRRTDRLRAHAILPGRARRRAYSYRTARDAAAAVGPQDERRELQPLRHSDREGWARPDAGESPVRV